MTIYVARPLDALFQVSCSTFQVVPPHHTWNVKPETAGKTLHELRAETVLFFHPSASFRVDPEPGAFLFRSLLPTTQ